MTLLIYNFLIAKGYANCYCYSPMGLKRSGVYASIAVIETSARKKINFILGKPPALWGDTQSLAVPGCKCFFSSAALSRSQSHASGFAGGQQICDYAKEANMKRPAFLLSASIAAVCLFLFPLSGQADLYDLTSGGQAIINAAIFTTSDSQSTGTGVIQSFVRIQASGTEEGYNTDGRPVQYDENTSAQFTRSLLLSAVPIVNIGGVNYREFLLDINQTNADPLLSLDAIKLYLLANGNITDPITSNPPFGPPLYDLGSNYLLLNYDLNAGSGSGDLFMYILDSAFTGPNQYVYLYSKFGSEAYPSNAGFEEWAVREAGTPIPEPVSMLLFGTGLVGIGGYMRKKFKQN